MAPLDDYGGHVNPHGGYHYHAVTGSTKEIEQSDQHAPMIGYAIEGSTNGQPDRLKKAFHADLNLYYVKDDAVKTWSGRDYIADTKEGEPTGEFGKIISIDYENDIAIAKVQISHPESNTPYIDYFMLAKANNQWTIIHKMFTKRVNK